MVKVARNCCRYQYCRSVYQKQRAVDRTTKLSNYIEIPSVEEYVMIEQDCVDVEVLRRKDGWFSRHYYLGDEVTFESIGLTTTVETIYDRVHNEDMLEFLAAKALGSDTVE